MSAEAEEASAAEEEVGEASAGRGSYTIAVLAKRRCVSQRGARHRVSPCVDARVRSIASKSIVRIAVAVFNSTAAVQSRALPLATRRTERRDEAPHGRVT